jgi:hypothetical protein
MNVKIGRQNIIILFWKLWGQAGSFLGIHKSAFILDSHRPLICSVGPGGQSRLQFRHIIMMTFVSHTIFFCSSKLIILLNLQIEVNYFYMKLWTDILFTTHKKVLFYISRRLNLILSSCFNHFKLWLGRMKFKRIPGTCSCRPLFSHHLILFHCHCPPSPTPPTWDLFKISENLTF